MSCTIVYFGNKNSIRNHKPTGHLEQQSSSTINSKKFNILDAPLSVARIWLGMHRDLKAAYAYTLR